MKVLYATFTVVIADQVSKFLVRGIQIPSLGISYAGMPLYSSREILGNLIQLTYVTNAGTAFGLGPGFTEVFAVFSLFASIAIFAYLYMIRNQGLGIRLSFALILGGAIGNMLDRVFLGPIFDGAGLFSGRVIDFIDINFFHLPLVFNIADAAVTIGVVMLVFFQRRLAAGSPELELAGGGETGISPQKGKTTDAEDPSNAA